MKKICVVTGTRAEYGLFYPILKKIKASKKLQLQLVATTMHLSAEYGNTLAQIQEDGFPIEATIENLLASNTNTAICKSTGLATMMLADVYQRLNPDVVLLLGDRYETLAAATSALLMKVPIAHIHGGEISEGVIDEQIRHAITKMANLHFTATDTYRQRIIQMGERPENVIVSGAPGIDNINNMQLMSKHELEENLNWQFGDKSILFTYHPQTREKTRINSVIDSLLRQIKALPESYHVLFTYSNADEGGRVINQALEGFAASDSKRFKVVKNLGQLRYLSAMKYVDVLVGNTSSGIIEAASFNKPVVNVGLRQRGRIRSDNVIDCPTESVLGSIKHALSNEFIGICQKVKNIYGQGNASDIIVSVLESKQVTLNKQFNDLLKNTND